MQQRHFIPLRTSHKIKCAEGRPVLSDCYWYIWFQALLFLKRCCWGVSTKQGSKGRNVD